MNTLVCLNESTGRWEVYLYKALVATFNGYIDAARYASICDQ